MHKLRINPLALQDMQEIKAYITDELSNPDAAQRIVRNILKSCENMRQSPFTGKKLTACIDLETGFRYCICGSYLIFYRVEDEFISVYRILYGRRDYLRILFGNLPEAEEEQPED